jgi:hypothetical protein
MWFLAPPRACTRLPWRDAVRPGCISRSGSSRRRTRPARPDVRAGRRLPRFVALHHVEGTMPAGQGDRKHPHRDHGRKDEGRDTDGQTQGPVHGPDVDAARIWLVGSPYINCGMPVTNSTTSMARACGGCRAGLRAWPHRHLRWLGQSAWAQSSKRKASIKARAPSQVHRRAPRNATLPQQLHVCEPIRHKEKRRPGSPPARPVARFSLRRHWRGLSAGHQPCACVSKVAASLTA